MAIIREVTIACTNALIWEHVLPERLEVLGHEARYLIAAIAAAGMLICLIAERRREKEEKERKCRHQKSGPYARRSACR
jgi:hypothetical protein